MSLAFDDVEVAETKRNCRARCNHIFLKSTYLCYRLLATTLVFCMAYLLSFFVIAYKIPLGLWHYIPVRFILMAVFSALTGRCISLTYLVIRANPMAFDIDTRRGYDSNLTKRQKAYTDERDAYIRMYDSQLSKSRLAVFYGALMVVLFTFLMLGIALHDMWS